MIQELHKYRDRLIQEEKDRYSEEYKKSKWYKEPTLEDVLSSQRLYADYISFENILEKGDKEEIKSYVALFEQAAHNYGASWWDDDLGCERTGGEWETEFYVTLRNIAAKIVGLSEREFSEFYEGRGV
ncbi:MAG: hypothetical protein J6I68_14340 [Butyrivibrio sp.]|uniref:hypothetical protein n=1 Tax=Butyrivibrio sp. TaxID=28121 RepID=UPI001B0A4E98|nr:hypothetical protein [Butyrivibrio sp.]MBO5620686.1 hypothetical protein [Butyrivibrio sp.]MBP3784420.1 hypothetical protein [Butyrivibrio sp.]